MGAARRASATSPPPPSFETRCIAAPAGKCKHLALPAGPAPPAGRLGVMAALENPYQPGSGMAPPVLAGRASLLRLAEERLETVAAGRALAQNLLFYGPRGNGKTALLTEIRRRARERNLRVEELPVDALTTEEKLVRHLQERAGVLGQRLTGAQVAGSASPRPRPHPPGRSGCCSPPGSGPGRWSSSWTRFTHFRRRRPGRSSMRSSPPNRNPDRSCCWRRELPTLPAGCARPRLTTSADSGMYGSGGCSARKRSRRSPSRRGCPGTP